MYNNVKEAYGLMKKKFPFKKITGCVEYNDIYVFQIVPLSFNHKNASKVLDSLYSVNKKDGSIRSFQPFMMTRDKYLSGKKITSFE